MVTPIRTRTPSWLKIAPALMAVLLIVGFSGWWFAVRESGYYLRTADARGIQPGDPVMREGVRVGQVVGVEATDNGALIEFRLAGDSLLRIDDLIRIRKGLTAAIAEVRIVRGCSGSKGAQPPEIPHGRILDEASRVALAAVQARCSGMGQRIEELLEKVDLEQAVSTFNHALEQATEWGSGAMEDASKFLRARGEDLAERLERSGLSEKADSIRGMIRDKLGGM